MFLEKDFGGHQILCNKHATASCERYIPTQEGLGCEGLTHFIRLTIIYPWSLGISSEFQSFGGYQSWD